MNEELEEEMSIVCNLGEDIARKTRKVSFQEGFDNGQRAGEDKFASLMTRLMSVGRMEDARRSAEDPEFRQKMYQELQLN